MWSHKFKLLLWKNWILVKRHPVAAFFEIAFPILVVIIFTAARQSTDPTKSPEIQYKAFQPFSTRCTFGYFKNEDIKEIGYAPDNEFYTKLITTAIGDRFSLNPFKTEAELNFWIRNQSAIEPVGAIQFLPVDSSSVMPKKLNYIIRMPQDPTIDTWWTDQIYYITPSKRSRLRGDSFSPPNEPPYYESCFLGIQNEIDRTFIKSVKQGIKIPDIMMNAFPYPAVVEEMFLTIAAIAFPFLFVMCMILSSKNIIKNIAIERETLLKESMKMMGLTSAMHWTSWFTKSFIMLIIPFTINCVLLTTKLASEKPMFLLSNPILIWIFLVIYIISVITLCFFIAVIFKKSSTAANVGSLIFFLMILPYTYFGDKFHSFPYFLKALFCMIPNTNMGQAVSLLINAEANEQGIHFGNLFKRDVDLKFSFGELLLYMLIGSILQLLLTIYVEKVFPGEFGISEPWYFPFSPLINFLKKQMGYETLANENVLQERKISNADYEEEPDSSRTGIRITNLSKKFGHKYAVDKLNLNMYEDQITVLLGHNGAGKTTTMSMLTGLFSPTSGTAYLNGKDVRSELEEARESLGICPQHNVLFEELTVKEHLIFFCSLKGMQDKRLISEEVKRYVNLLGLKEKVNAQSKTLSGGMKRRLSIAIALCGDAKIVILDEPTSGMDPDARRSLWDLLIDEKRGRTILLSTHFMDEADILGDRIAIMTEGRLRTVGSSFFLKKKFGTGYRLTCVKEDGFQNSPVLSLLHEYASDAYLESDGQAEATYVISEDKLPMFANIFKNLEDNAQKLKVSSFGCSLSTLEEVFLKLGVESMGEEEDEEMNHSNSQSHVNIPVHGTSSLKVTGWKLTLYQIEAMLLKKFHVFRRTWKTIIYVALFSLWMIVVVMSAPQISFNSAPKLEISFDSYEETHTVIEDKRSTYLKSYQSLFRGKDSYEMVSSDSNFAEYILEKGNVSISMVNLKYLIGATLTDNSITAWFNGQPFHTVPLTLNTINRAILKSAMGNDYDIVVTNSPYTMPIKSEDEDHLPMYEDPKNTVFALISIFFLLTYWPVIFIGHYIKERDSRAKLLQYISGTNRFVFWFTSYFFDYIVFMLVCSGIIGCIGIYQRNHYATAEELLTLLAICFSYAMAMLPFIYAFSFLFTKFSTGETILSLVSLILGILYGIYKIAEVATKDTAYHVLISQLYLLGLLFAPFNLVEQLTILGLSFISGKSIFSFGEDGIGKNVAMNFLSAFLFMGFCLLKDHHLFDWFFYTYLNRPKMLPLLNQNIDSDVDAEIQKVKEMSREQIRDSNLVLQGLTKYYGKMLAVNQLYLDVERRECFGLLGVNGAGKTTTFKMMTGDELIGAGDAWVRGYSMKNQMDKVHQLIGYCPQYDAVLPELTGIETLKIFSLIRGIPKNEIRENIKRMSIEIGFQQHLRKKIKECSGGNKRKLSTCLALLGEPDLIFLDEPTTGIDPQAKRRLWDVINRTRDAGHAVVITSHSMDECEALCTKIGIMVKGQFRCLGSVQYLKNKYSKGFVLTIKIGKDDADLVIEIQNRVLQAFPSAELKEKYLDILTFHITNMNLKWSQVFGICAQMKKDLNINDYSLSQMSLEQVFLIFSKSGIYQEGNQE